MFTAHEVHQITKFYSEKRIQDGPVWDYVIKDTVVEKKKNTLNSFGHRMTDKRDRLSRF